MAQTLQTLSDDVSDWLNRRDLGSKIPGWVGMAENDMAELLRVRCMVQRATQDVDAAFITLPCDWVDMEGLRDSTTGLELTLEDHWTGPMTGTKATAYRLIGSELEFLPHVVVPVPVPDPWVPQNVTMTYYARPKGLVAASDTNDVLQRFYSVYYHGVCRYASMFEGDQDRLAEAQAGWEAAVTQANAWKARSDYAGAPLRSVPAVAF